MILKRHHSVHQFCRIGRLAMVSNYAGLNVDFPPFFLTMATNTVTQLNAVGCAGHAAGVARSTPWQIFPDCLPRPSQPPPSDGRLAELPPDVLGIPEVQEVLAFCQTTKPRRQPVLFPGRACKIF